MSKRIKCGARVRVKSTNEIGVVKGREVIKLDNKHVKVQYVVKTGEGFENWKPFAKKELDVIKKEASYPKHYVKTYTSDDGRVLTLVGIVNKIPSVTLRTLNIGFAIKNPTDASDNKMGEKIAKRRAMTRPVCYMSCLNNEFKENMVLNIMDAKANYMLSNIEKYIEK